MVRKPSFARLALTAFALSSAPVSAQVQVLVDGQMQRIPAGVVRTITYTPGGEQVVRDEPFGGQTAPGYATITTTETTESDEDGSNSRTSVVTRIEPMAVSAFSYATPIPAQTMVQASNWPQPVSYYIPASGGQAQPIRPGQAWQSAHGQPGPAEPNSPHLDLDDTALISAGDDDKGKVLRVHRDPMTGHFVTAIYINGVKLRAIIDTGAQQTVLSARDARASGADRDIIRSTPMSGIGGTTMLNVARVRSMDVGGQHLGSFAACIGAEGIPYTLLGQTEINRLGRIVIEGGVMTISPSATMLASR